jgi:signal peptidase II
LSEETQIIETDSKPSLSKWIIPFAFLALVLALDQSLKYWIKNNMILHTEKAIFGDWFILHFTENKGMAFGMEFFGTNGKYALSILRIGVSMFGLWYLIKHIKKNSNLFFLICVALILGGALGNIIDCVFYGVWYDHMNLYKGGYLLGWVVDMLYFPIIETHYPEWSPFKPGQEFIFFSPVFNIADAAISIGVISIVVFQKRFFPKNKKNDASLGEETDSQIPSDDNDGLSNEEGINNNQNTENNN